MFELDLPIGLTKAWTDAALGCMAASTSAALDVANQTLSVWSRSSEDAASQAAPATPRKAASEPATRSWYRAPSQGPFDFGSAWPAGNLAVSCPTGWPVMMPPVGLFMWPGSATVPSLLQSWVGMMAAAGLFLSPPRPAFDWRAFGFPGAPWFWNGLAWPDPTRVREQPAPFSVYRSNGGHAVAQVTFPNQVIAAVAFPPVAAMMTANLFRWP
jgi:hypothetical protein